MSIPYQACTALAKLRQSAAPCFSGTEQMLKRPTNTIDKGIWPTTSNTTFSIPNAGYVNRANVEWEAFDIQNFASTIGSGRTSNPNVDQHVHFGKAENEDWNVYRLNLHGSQNIDGTMIPAKNFVDTVAGQTMLFSNNPLSVYYDGNSINDSDGDDDGGAWCGRALCA